MRPTPCVCMATRDAKCRFEPIDAHRRPLGARDVLLELTHCGVCHSDVHAAAGHLRRALGATKYPAVPGHELAGEVVAIGDGVTRFAIGDRCGVGCVVDACLACEACGAGDEHRCARGMVGTYGDEDKHGRAGTWPVGGRTMGGYATHHVVDERFGIRVPKAYPMEAAGPVMCAGVTVYDPMKRYGVGAGSAVGVVGLGGLGVMAVKIARAMGASEVVVFSRSETKRSLARRCGATAFASSEDADAMRRARGTLDLILNTVPVAHDYLRFQKLLKKRERGRPRAKQVVLGLHAGLVSGMVARGVRGENSPIVASAIGGIRATQEVMDLCAAHGIVPELEILPVSRLTEIYEALDSGNDSGVRYVLDIAAFAADVRAGRVDALRTSGPPRLVLDDRNAFGPRGVVRDLARVFCGCHVC